MQFFEICLSTASAAHGRWLPAAEESGRMPLQRFAWMRRPAAFYSLLKVHRLPSGFAAEHAPALFGDVAMCIPITGLLCRMERVQFSLLIIDWPNWSADA
jgi:hypothetical protein